MRTTITITALAAAAAQAQDLNQTIVGCVEVECPAAADNVNDNCAIADTGSFPSIGLTRVPTDNSALSGLSWVKGFNITDANSQRTFHNSFYLGTPPDLNLSNSTGGCAVFLHGASGSLSFGQNETSATAEGTCADAMGSLCVDALVSRARTLVEGYANEDDRPSISDTCARLQRDLEDGRDDACASISNGDWSNFVGAALTGEGAPQPISQQQNSSSTCWPVIPKQDGLTLISEYHTTGSDLVEDAERAQWAITPVLTVFYSAGNGSLVTDVDASLSCVKTMGPARASLDTINDGSDDHDSGATTLSASKSWAPTAFAATLAIFLISYVA
ncbi:hypothetical protein F4818DRAFT_73676 [Hypoxylon cercidicola]|nr:hypothetical protein F4818DRAFT_73676 [Hypoxylon cercidicola]